jgi:hypothetical protein
MRCTLSGAGSCRAEDVALVATRLRQALGA